MSTLPVNVLIEPRFGWRALSVRAQARCSSAAMCMGGRPRRSPAEAAGLTEATVAGLARSDWTAISP